MLKAKTIVVLLSMMIFGEVILTAQENTFDDPILNDKVVFEEKDGLVSVEAEFYYKQSLTETRKWYRTSKYELPKVGRDDDDQHIEEASNNAYIEILPDERVNHSDKLIVGQNFTNDPGTMAILHYKIKFDMPGRYFVWVRAFSTGGEDNGLHVGLNGEWPAHGQRMQWCDGKNSWTWASKQRTKEIHCGVPHEIYLDIEKAGVHEIQFSMREDGFEFDKFILTNNINYTPLHEGPEVLVAQGKLPRPFPAFANPQMEKSYFRTISNALPENKFIAAQEFTIEQINFYNNGKNWLAINPDEHKEAQASIIFNYQSGNYDLVFVGVGENDGQSKFQILINDIEIGRYSPPLTQNLFEEGEKFNLLLENVSIKNGDKITVKAKVDTNGKEWTRGRWAGVVFTPVAKGATIQGASSSFSPN
jgi:hypothetical protein